MEKERENWDNKKERKKGEETKKREKNKGFTATIVTASQAFLWTCLKSKPYMMIFVLLLNPAQFSSSCVDGVVSASIFGASLLVRANL